MIKAIVFDVGGVLQENVTPFVKKDIQETLGLEDETLNLLWEELVSRKLGQGKISEEEFWAEFLTRTNINIALPLQSLFIREFEKRYNPNLEMLAIAKTLKKNDYKIAVISNTIEPHVKCNIEKGLYDAFPVRVFSNEVGLRKDNPQMLRIALNRLGVKPDEIIFIDDEEKYLKVAQGLGMCSFLFKNSDDLKKQFDALEIKYMDHGAGVIVVRKDATVLMQHRENKPGIFYPDHWAYPAGSVHQNEDFGEAARRELEEETGYKPIDIYPLPIEDYIRSDGQLVRRHIFWALYDEKQEIRCMEGFEMKFVSLHFLKDKKMLPGQERLCRFALEEAGKKRLLSS